MQTIEITENEAGQRADKFLRKLLPSTSLGMIYKMLRTKKIKVNGKKIDPKYSLALGDIIAIYANLEMEKKKPAVVEASYKELSIVYEDKDVLLVNKPCGILTHPADKNDKDSLIQQSLAYLTAKGDYQPEKEKTFTPAACNRLDRNTSGLVIVAKNFSALQSVNQLIREKKLNKYYLALVKGKIDKKGEIKGFLTKDNKDNKVTVNKNQDGKAIHTVYQPLKANDKCSLLEIDLLTGRTHQIRAHLASIGHGLAGDMKYGDKSFNQYFYQKHQLKYQFLHAYKIVFAKDSSLLPGRVFTADLPENLLRIEKTIFTSE